MSSESPRPSSSPRGGAGLLFWIAASCLGLIGLLTIMAVFHDRAAMLPAWQAAMHVLLSPWSLTVYAACGCIVFVGAWYLWRVREAAAGRHAAALPARAVIAFLLLLVATIAGAGFLLWKDVDTAFRDERFAQQQGIARLKVRLIDQWVQERIVDLQHLAVNLRGFPSIGQSDVRELIELVFAQMLASHRESVAVALLGADGKPIVATGLAGLDVAPVLEAPLATLAAEARKAGGAVTQSIVAREGTVARVFVAVARSIAQTGPNAGVVAVVLNDPTVGLLREVTAWPSRSATSHILVAQRDGHTAVYLVPVPGLSERPFLRLPLTTPNINAIRALEHGAFVHEVTDFRGIPVLAAAEPVAALPWVVIAKTDLAEALAPLERRERRMGLIFGGAILVSMVLVFAVWRGQRIALASAARSYASEREAMMRHADALVRNARDAILLIAEDGRVVQANAAAEALYGYTGQELLRMTVRDLRQAEDSEFEHHWRAAAASGGALFEAVHRRRDGTLIDVEVSSGTIEVEGRVYRQSFIRDIGRRKALERQVERLLRIERALQVATGVLLRSTSESELFQRMCGVIVDVAGYRMAFVALADNDADGSVSIAATAGHEAGFFASHRLSWREGDTSLTGTAIRTGEIQVNQDYEKNPNVAGWRDEAVKRGYLSSIALPIRDGTRVVGVLGLTSSERHAFDAQEVGLLSTLADDISYGVAALRARNRGDGD